MKKYPNEEYPYFNPEQAYGYYISFTGSCRDSENLISKIKILLNNRMEECVPREYRKYVKWFHYEFKPKPNCHYMCFDDYIMWKYIPDGLKKD